MKEKNKNLINEKKKKLPFNVFSKKGLVALAMAGVMIASPLMLAGCSDGKDGTDGTRWESGLSYTEFTDAKVGDFFIDTDDYILYKKTVDGWTIVMENYGKPGEKGDKGDDGTSVYVGYDGYIWQGSTKTNYMAQIDKTGEEFVFENSIGAYTNMRFYFDNEYVDLSTNVIALMQYYKPNANLTIYDDTKITEIQVVSENAGTLHIGSASVSDIANARKNGTALTAKTTSYDVVAGVNTITFETPITVAEGETVVLGGSGSTARLYVAKGIPIDDEVGNFTLVNGQANTGVICETGEYADTLAVKITVENLKTETAVFPNMLTDYPLSGVGGYSGANAGTAPYKFEKADEKFSGNKIVKIGVVVKALSANEGEKPYFTVYKVKTSVTSNFHYSGIPVKVYFPEDTQVNTWAYADCNIELAEDETLAFGSPSGDTLTWAWSSSGKEEYNFYAVSGGTANTGSLLFDIYVGNDFSFENQIEKINEKEQVALEANQVEELKSILNGKKLSILGDSISTYPGYSNDSTNTNSTIGSNALYYNGSNCGIDNVDQTWWKQAIDMTNMSLLVNNSYSGDRVTTGGQTRCEQLHDDTGDNAGTNPDVVAVYLGINDFNASVELATFTSNYDTMISKIRTKYGDDVKLFLFTHVANNNNTNDTLLEQYNEAIKTIANKYNCVVVDYANSGINRTNLTTYMGDNSLHPNQAGMDVITQCFWKALYKAYVTDAQ